MSFRNLPLPGFIAFAVCVALIVTVAFRFRARAVNPESRVAGARANAEAGLRELCKARGLHYPPGELFLRAFKREGQLEVWAREGDEPFRLLREFRILASSGKLGPKRKEGDRQVPEGFYAISMFNPRSLYHLSMKVDYPNASDRILSDQEKPGGDIFIHGSNVTIGCLPLGDDEIERLYILATDVQAHGGRKIQVHIFPGKMEGSEWSQIVADHGGDAKLVRFWENLKPVYDWFQTKKRLPEVGVKPDGSYTIR